MLYLVPCDDRFKFASREWLCCLLNLKPPYNICQERVPPSLKTAPRDSGHATAAREKVVLNLLDRLVASKVPSLRTANLLWELSNVVICNETKYCRQQAPSLYDAWCEDLWIQYLLVNRLPKNSGSTPSELTRRIWENALQEAFADLASDSAYSSDAGSVDGAEATSDEDQQDDSGEDPDDGSDDEIFSDEDVNSATAGFEMLSVSKKKSKQKPTFDIYPQIPVHESHARLVKLMKMVIAKKDQVKGHIYIFRQPGLDGYFKIGYVKANPSTDPVQNRLQEWKRDCKYNFIKVFRADIECKAARKIESLILLTLNKYRRVQEPPCAACHERDGSGKHNEWFEVDKKTACRVIRFWTLFARTQPYNEHGYLSDFWSDKIEAQVESKEIPKGYPIMSWVEAMTPLVELLGHWDDYHASRWV